MKDKRRVVIFDGTVLDNVTGVWFRKPQHALAEALQVSPAFQDYAANALRAHFQLLYTSWANASWVSDFFAMRRANDKALQLEVATRVGLRAPDTMFTSDKLTAEAFIEQHNRTIVKPYQTYHHITADTHSVFYTSVITKTNPPDLTNLHISPLVFQQAIDTAYDVRVTVIGEQIFAARIVATGQTPGHNVRDWRLGHYEGEIKVEPLKDFPTSLSGQCIQLVRELGLVFGAIDFVVDKSGNYWFLENNPNGQWAFIEKMTKLPIGEAIADMLQRPKDPN